MGDPTPAEIQGFNTFTDVFTWVGLPHDSIDDQNTTEGSLAAVLGIRAAMHPRTLAGCNTGTQCRRPTNQAAAYTSTVGHGTVVGQVLQIGGWSRASTGTRNTGDGTCSAGFSSGNKKNIN